MTDQDNLRDRIKEVLDRVDDAAESQGTGMGVATTAEFAQAIIDEFGMTVHGDDCGYHEIYGRYDTRFEN